MTTLASDSCCCQSKSLNISQCLGLELAAAKKGKKWTPNFLRPGLSSSYTIYLMNTRDSKCYLEFPAPLAGCSTAEWGELSVFSQTLSHSRALCTSQALQNILRLQTKAVRSSRGKWAVWMLPQGTAPACELRWLKTFYIKLLRLLLGFVTWFSGLSCAEPGVWLHHPCASLPSKLILWLCGFLIF